MAFDDAGYKSTIEAGLQAAIGSETAEADLAQVFADALKTAVSQLEAATGDVIVPADGLVSVSGGGPVTGSALTAEIPEGNIK